MKSKRKVALITGITGQDGSYLAEFLLKKNYVVHGIKRRSSSINSERIDHLYMDPLSNSTNFHIHYGDLIDSLSIMNLINNIKPEEIYNLAAQSHVKVSFEIPEYTSDVNALGTLRILEAIKSLNLQKKTKFYQASTSELFGDNSETPQNEKTTFMPNSPYAISKLYSYYITNCYRKAYGIFAVNGILFNHESPKRGETFVSKKIVNGLVNIKHNNQKCLFLGNLYSKRDWGHAKDYVEMQWKMLQMKNPKDLVIATGHQYSVKDFVNEVAKQIDLKIKWSGKGLKERAINVDNNKTIIKIHKKYFRPNEVNSLLGDAKLARKLLNWKPKHSFQLFVKDMINYELSKI